MRMAMNRVMSPLPLALLLLLSGCGSSTEEPAPPPQPDTTVQGRVVAPASSPIISGARPEADGRVGVPGVQCSLPGSDLTTTTDAEGRFTFNNLGGGDFRLLCRKRSAAGKGYSLLHTVGLPSSGGTVDLGALELRASGAIEGVALMYGSADSGGIQVTLPGALSLGHATTDAQGRYLVEDVPEGTYLPSFQKEGRFANALQPVVVLAGETARLPDFILHPSWQVTGSLRLNEGQSIARSRTVTVELSASQGITAYQLSESADFSGAQWRPIEPRVAWTFGADGTQRLHVHFADPNGLDYGGPRMAEVFVDTSLPEGTLQLQSGDRATATHAITLALTATDATSSVTHMRIGTRAGLDGVAWEPFAETRAWSLDETEGAHTLFAQFMDTAGNTSAEVSLTVELDWTPPEAVGLSVEGNGFVQRVVYLMTAVQGATHVALSEDATFLPESWVFLDDERVSFELSPGDGVKTVYARFRDAAGNLSGIVSTQVVKDSQPPTTPALRDAEHQTWLPYHRVMLSAPAQDEHLAGYQLLGGQYTEWTDTEEQEGFIFDLPAVGSYLLQVRAVDLAGNTSEWPAWYPITRVEAAP